MNTFKFRLIGTVDMVVTIEAEDAETASGLAYDYPADKLSWVNWEVEEIEEEEEDTPVAQKCPPQVPWGDGVSFVLPSFVTHQYKKK